MGGDHGHGPPKIPDWKCYQVEGIPQLMKVQNALAAKGLKDPWLRNEVWRYMPQEWDTHGKRIRTFLFRGFRYGFAAFVVTICLEKLLSIGQKGHGHGNGHGNGHDDDH